MNPDDYPEVVEAAARALYENTDSAAALRLRWENVPEDKRPYWRRQARAALAAALPLFALDRDAIARTINGAVPADVPGFRYRYAERAADAVVAASPLRTVPDALREAAHAAVTEDEGVSWDDDYDRATVAAWLEDRADRLAGGDGYCTCNGSDSGGRMGDCGVAAHRTEWAARLAGGGDRG